MGTIAFRFVIVVVTMMLGWSLWPACVMLPRLTKSQLDCQPKAIAHPALDSLIAV